jgi:LysM repeat protein
VQPGDECQKIADANEIPLLQLILLNPTINEACTNLQPGQELCLKLRSTACWGDAYAVAEGDTCASIAAARGVSAADLIAGNPSIDEACTNLQIGQQLCIPFSSKPASSCTLHSVAAGEAPSPAHTASPTLNCWHGTPAKTQHAPTCCQGSRCAFPAPRQPAASSTPSKKVTHAHPLQQQQPYLYSSCTASIPPSTRSAPTFR